MKNIYRDNVKRGLDIALSALALIILWPVMAVVAVLVAVKLGTPVLFIQERPGLHGKVFKMYKFRSMTDERDENGELLPDEVRLTRFGRMLRSTSLDELPELINILKGDMSIVGPRPLLVRYLPLYSEEQAHRHDVRPGFTGLAQAFGRNSISWSEKFKKDVYYVRHVSFALDLTIIIKTVITVVTREGVNTSDGTTPDYFNGHN